MSKMKLVCVVCLCLALVFVADGCKSKKNKGLKTDLAPEKQSGEGMSDIDMTKLNFTRATELKPIYFDYDKSDVRADAQAILKDNSDKMKQTQGQPVVYQIEGHCDERGTQEYNMALGERRALATRSYLMKLGVSGDRVLTISYGEEMPADSGHNEAAWAKNRRCEFNKATK